MPQQNEAKIAIHNTLNKFFSDFHALDPEVCSDSDLSMKRLPLHNLNDHTSSESTSLNRRIFLHLFKEMLSILVLH
jgi:hypothetical protein